MSPPISRDGWVNVAGGAVEERRWPCFSSVRSTGVLPYIIFSAVIFLALAASTLFRLIEPVKGWWFPLAPISFIVLSTLVALLILMHDPVPGGDWGGDCALRHTFPQISSSPARCDERSPAP